MTAERHGAIRVGSVSELADAADLFAAFGMYPVGIYDLRPTHADQLARNPFQVFVDADTQAACVSDNSDYNPDWLAGQIGHHIHDPYELYEKAAS